LILPGVLIGFMVFAVIYSLMSFTVHDRVGKQFNCSEYQLPFMGVKTLLGEYCVVSAERLK